LKTAAFIFVAPLLGMALGALIMLLVSWILYRQPPRRVDRWFRRVQLFSSAAYSLGHGGNDAQKTMGVIWLLLIANGITTADRLPPWVVMSCFVAMGVGTMCGGWRIVKTMGQRITKLKPVGGFAAEPAGSITLFLATHFGIPVSTTHTITGAIMGVGTTKGTSNVRWAVAGNIVIAWLLTIPASAAIAALAWWIGGALV
jgi:PiT family inorganic phosphate transporter